MKRIIKSPALWVPDITELDAEKNCIIVRFVGSVIPSIGFVCSPRPGHHDWYHIKNIVIQNRWQRWGFNEPSVIKLLINSWRHWTAFGLNFKIYVAESPQDLDRIFKLWLDGNEVVNLHVNLLIEQLSNRWSP